MFSGKLFTIVSAVLAVAVNGSPIEGGELQARALGNVQLCTDSGAHGNCVTLPVDSSVCNNVPTGFDNDISSVVIDQGLSCTLFDDINCGGKSLPLNAPGNQNLAQVGFDDTTSSFNCKPL